MYHENYEKTLKLACEIHSTYHAKIDLNNQDRKLAIYYMQGGSLTQAYVALSNWSYGDLNGVYRAQRFIAETNKILEFLSLEEDVSRQLKNFFKDGFIQLPDFDNKNKHNLKSKILKVRGHDEETYKKFQGVTKLLSQEFSKGCHPTLYSSAYNSNKYTGEFDYQLTSQEFKYYPIRNFDFANFIIIPAVLSVYTFSQAFNVEPQILDRLRYAIDLIQKQSSNFHLKRKQKM